MNGLRTFPARGGPSDPPYPFHLTHPCSYNLFVEMTAQIRRNVIYNVYMFAPQRITKIEEGAAAAVTEGGEKAEPVAAAAGAAKEESNGNGKVAAKAGGKAKAKAR